MGLLLALRALAMSSCTLDATSGQVLHGVNGEDDMAVDGGAIFRGPATAFTHRAVLGL